MQDTKESTSAYPAQAGTGILGLGGGNPKRLFFPLFCFLVLVALAIYFLVQGYMKLNALEDWDNRNPDKFAYADFVKLGFVDPATFSGSKVDHEKVIAYIELRASLEKDLSLDKKIEFKYDNLKAFNELIEQIDMDETEPTPFRRKAVSFAVSQVCGNAYINACDYKSISYDYQTTAIKAAYKEVLFEKEKNKFLSADQSE